ncbi:hypothetical protein F2Q68_00034475 [Brassica cretica]|uniref:Uncharacterized protein n=2 Tax=Brassica cretica TaxID=69181 RepID=A0A8S9H540_BRACR|nr:hypothetical protein F2Q68_00034475 [Brassica cretica]KAF3485744.1 hypothetical protein F2Q69_00053264 [Brassica cretica]KAF3593561.1 hypothetical protein DY000_02022290 [Brassica cretica]
MVENIAIICILAAGCSQFRSYRGRRKSIIRFLKGTWHRSLLLCLFHDFLQLGARLDPRGAEALEEYKKSLELMATRKAAIHWVVPAGGSNIHCSKALASFNSEVFPMTPTRPSLDEDTSKVVCSLQGDVLQVASQLFHLKGRMKNRSATKAVRLREEKDAILAKDEEIEAWKLRDKEEEICELRHAAEVFDAEKIKAVNDAKVVVRWELMWEWLDDQTDRWDQITSFEQYKVVKISEAEFLGLPPPSFESSDDLRILDRLRRTGESSVDPIVW